MLQLEIPCIELMELLKLLAPTANKAGSPTPLTDRNIRVSFEFGQIFGSVVRNSCCQVSYVNYDDMPDELQGKVYLIPYKETVTALSIKSDTVQAYVQEDTTKTLIIKSNKTVIKLTLEEEVNFPKPKDIPTDVSWTIQGSDLKKLISTKSIYQVGSGGIQGNLVYIANKEDSISSYAFAGFIFAKINIPNDYHRKGARVLCINQEVASILKESIHDAFEVSICQEYEIGLLFQNTCIISNTDSDGAKQIATLDQGIKNALSDTAIASVQVSTKDLSDSINLYNTLGYEEIGNKSIQNPVSVQISKEGCYLLSNLEAYGTVGKIHIEGVCEGNAVSKFSFGGLKSAIQIFGKNDTINVRIFNNFALFEHNSDIVILSKMV